MKTPENILIAASITAVILCFAGCKKKSPVYVLEGIVRAHQQETALSGVSLKLEQQAVDGNVYSGVYTTAATTTSDQNGKFRLSWPRTQIARLRLLASQPDYIPSTVELSPDDFTPDEPVRKTIRLYPEAFVEINLRNSGSTSPEDYLKFRLLNQFSCECCTTDLLEVQGAIVDTTYSCRVYGNSWVRYFRESESGGTFQVITDSIWCPSFITTNLTVNF